MSSEWAPEVEEIFSRDSNLNFFFFSLPLKIGKSKPSGGLEGSGDEWGET